MKASGDNKLGLSDIPSPILKGFLERLERSAYKITPGLWQYMPCKFSGDHGGSTWELYYSARDKAMFASEYDYSGVQEISYELNGSNGVKTNIVIRTGSVKLLREGKYELDVSRSP